MKTHKLTVLAWWLLLLYPNLVCAHSRGGEALGVVSGAGHPVSGLDQVLAMIAVGLWGVCALFMVTSIITGQVAALRSHRGRVVVRVAGSWIAAIGLLMLGWALRAHQ